jgi:probable ABC transporter permease protein HI_1471
MLVLAALLVLTMLLALGAGQSALPLPRVAGILLDKARGLAIEPIHQQIIFQIRLPRILCAGIAGAALALSGASLQGIFRNPLVDPHVIGVTSGAAFGGTMAIFLGLGIYGLFFSTLLAGLVTLVLIFVFSHRLIQRSLLMLILTGMIISGFFSALVSLLQYLSDTEDKLPSIVFWLMGSFATSNPQKLLMLVVPVTLCSVVLLGLRWRMNLLSLGEREARALGVNIRPLRWLVIFCSGMLVASQVAVSGSIGWVGLIIPHLSRMLVGANHQQLLPCTLLMGALYLIIVDTLARTLSTSEIPVSIITSLLGAPLFAVLVYQLRRGQKEQFSE